MVIEKQEEVKKYWDVVALEAEKEESAARAEKWRKTAINWLSCYTETKARDFIVHTIEKYAKLEENAQVLDVGCGPGKWVNLLAERGYVTTGVDSSPWMIRLAKKRLRENLRRSTKLYVMDVAELELPSNSYDMVNCVTVLQHIFNDEDWKKAVHGLVRVAKPSGYVLIFEAAPSFILKRRTHHLRFRSMKEYMQEFKKAGAHLRYWRATDLSFPITYLGLRRYAASFSKKVYYYFAGEFPVVSPSFLSFLSRISVSLAKPIDYKLTETPLGFLSVGKILLFRKAKE